MARDAYYYKVNFIKSREGTVLDRKHILCATSGVFSETVVLRYFSLSSSTGEVWLEINW